MKMIKKSQIYIVILAVLLISCSSNSKKYDERAIASLDNLSETIGNLEACSYTLNVFVSKDSVSHYSNLNDVYMRGPNKMYIHTIGTKGETSYWYDGKQMAYFIYGKKMYDAIPAPANIIKTIDVLHNTYNIDIPAADFFYPTLTDDLMDQFDQVLFFGEENIDNIECIVIEASNNDVLAQIWIEKNTNLPHKLVISHPNDTFKYYEAVFSNWRINPRLPDLLFEFAPPANSTQVSFKAKNK